MAKRTVTLEIFNWEEKELMPLYEESRRLRATLGLSSLTFEEWYEMQITFGRLQHIKFNAAEFIEVMKKQVKKEANGDE